MLLLTGPAGSGKTFRVLERLREALRRRDPGVRLLTPTATMAQHLQSRMAHEGFVFRPATIQTLSRFLEWFAADTKQVSDPLLYLIVEEAARRVNRTEFARVAGLPGFCAALARSMEELSSVGCDAERLAAGLARGGAPLGEAFLAVYREVDRELARRGLVTRAQRLLRAAERIAGEGLDGAYTIWLDGFYALPDPELAVIDAMRRHADVTVTLPSAEITEPTRQRLLEMGFVEETRGWAQPAVRRELCAAASIEREADEIARRILEQAAAGRPFREIGVVVRNPEIYAQVLRATLDRFRIPARFYFDAELSRHAVVRYLGGIVDAMLGGWEHGATLAAIRLAPGMECDAFDFAVREQMPGSGLAALRGAANERHATAGLPELLRELERLGEWRGLQLGPGEWAARLQGLRALFKPGWPEPGGHEIAAVGRGQAAALDLFDGAMEEAAGALGTRPVPLNEFWRAAKSVLRLTPLRVPDGRRNVVHVLGAHEARQWRLPVVFVCGMVEKQFPKFHAQDPFLPETARAQLQQAGVRVRAAADFEAEERFLFDWAVTRATESLTLSYPRFDTRGQPNLPSLYLEGLEAATSSPEAVTPRVSGRVTEGGVRSEITSADLLEALAQRYQAFQPTALESYLQCPFLFFGRTTLRLRAAPKRPEERLDFLMQGQIAHAVLADLHRGGGPLADVFDRVFRRLCEEKHVPRSYRTEACRERMLADLCALVADPLWKPGYEVRAEQEFNYKLTADVEMRGRIDRIDVTPDGGGLVTDYKYSGAQGTRERGKSDKLLQPQLYLLALEQFFHLRPDGMSYWGFRGGIQRTPWMPFEPASAVERTLRVAGEIRAGRVAPQPADPTKCARCDYRDVCRFAAAAAEVDEEAAAWD
ncbi:MAG TPA: PD-(D/E)XK nuclease family protein [Bryobacteraceae bacterium]|nr:PD-(D/E)XK nuclease family protein [Bryobacteraceae bacterium]